MAGTDDEAGTARAAQAQRVTQEVVRQVRRGTQGGTVLEDLDPALRSEVSAALRLVLRSLVEQAWQAGWQPADLRHHGRRHLRARAGRLVDDILVEQLSGYARSSVDPRWWAQLPSCGVDRPAAPAGASRRRPDRDAGWAPFCEDAVAVLRLLLALPVLEQIGPLPGQARPEPDDVDVALDDKVLTRVRRLLAKAESTPYEAEAETFTAGAQALMARHSLDRAVVEAAARRQDAAHEQRRHGGCAPGAVRIGVDRPYEAPKALLLHLVSEANGCRAVWRSGLGLSTVVGSSSDLRTVELLYTSLMLQASTALQREVTTQPAGRRGRGRAFRASFLTGFAVRTGERLRAVVQEQARQASCAARRPDGLVHVLADRSQAVERETRRLFPATSTASVGSVRDLGGWVRGRAAADLAQWGTGAAVARGSAG
jgi:hypothetical protein